jgi:hypothetical protein
LFSWQRQSDDHKERRNDTPGNVKTYLTMGLCVNGGSFADIDTFVLGIEPTR